MIEFFQQSDLEARLCVSPAHSWVQGIYELYGGILN